MKPFIWGLVFTHSCLFFQSETLNTGTQANVFCEASITVQKKTTDYTSLHVHKYVSSSCNPSVSDSLRKIYWILIVAALITDCKYLFFYCMIFPLRKKKRRHQTNSMLFVFVWALKCTKKCASGIPITFGKSLKRQAIKAQQIASCSRFPCAWRSCPRKYEHDSQYSCFCFGPSVASCFIPLPSICF